MIYDQTQTFLDEYKIRFRKRFSTDLTLPYLSKKTATGFKSGLYTSMIIINLKKTFDMKSLSIKWNAYVFLKMLFFGLDQIYQIESLK